MVFIWYWMPWAPRIPLVQVAARVGSAEVVSVLLEARAAVDRPDTRGVTALHVAAVTGNLNVLRLLIAASAGLYPPSCLQQNVRSP